LKKPSLVIIGGGVSKLAPPSHNMLAQPEPG
jgi:hypothetical protein